MVILWWNRMFESVLLTLEADTELCGDPSRDALTEVPGTRSLSETECKEHKQLMAAILQHLGVICPVCRKQGLYMLSKAKVGFSAFFSFLRNLRFF